MRNEKYQGICGMVASKYSATGNGGFYGKECLTVIAQYKSLTSRNNKPVVSMKV